MLFRSGEAKRLPPVLIIQGTKDDNLTPDMAERFASAYSASGGLIQLEKFIGAPHAFIAKDPSSPDSIHAIQTLIEFIRRER